ncbi:hypothetical protein IGS74_18835 [Aureimonas sp. OT7]|uniref:hypothetical protein n=1 Tax=Aureimonas sp. OT7 TaxID=2816454 RepID=UPI001786933A|nr:hypothetical protein [Aureimonas sp. OT7]QOG06538.1 hypothetical protein IGS74_18835 [Aureimonas sp. OT7]
MTEQDKFLSRLAEARDEGLVDVKFFFHPSRAVKAHDIYEGLNQIEEAIASGECVRHSGWAGNLPS